MKRILVGILLAILLFITACTTISQEEIKIGIVLPLTGAWAVGGEATYKGILIAQEEINAEGGVNGKSIKLIIEDTKSAPTTAVTAVEKLVNVDKVQAIIGGALSGEAIPIAPVAQRNKVVLLSPLALTTPLERAGDWVFKLRESTAVHAEVTVQQIAKQGHRKIAILSQHYEACDDFLNLMPKYFDQQGITVISTERYDAEEKDLRTHLEKLKAANPDAWFACGLYQDLGLVFKQADELKFKKPAFSIVAIENKKLFEIAGNAAEGTIFTSTKWSCEHAKSFCDTFEQKYNTTADYRSAFGYDSMKILAEAITRKGTTAEEIRQGLLSIQDYYGASGKTSFDKEGNAQKEVVVKQVKGNNFVTVE